MVEPIFFHQGLNYDTISALQKPGFLKKADNILLEREGIQNLRPFFGNVNSTPVNAIHNLKAWRNKVFITDGTHLRGNSGTGDFTDLCSAFANWIWQFKVYKDFIVGANGTDFILIDDDMNVYPAQVEGPTTVPTGAAGAGGNPNGNYKLYVSYFITWPNGHTYETGLSAIDADISVTNQKIEWTNIPICPYAALHGTAPTILRTYFRPKD